MGLVSGLYRGCGCSGIIALALLIGGAQTVYTGLTNRQAVSMSCADYLAKRPAGKWLKLSDCQLDRMDAPVKEFAGSATEMYIPVRPANARPGTEVHILLASKDAADLDIVRDAKKMKDHPEDLSTYLTKHLTKMRETRDIEGVIQYGIDSSDKDRAKLRDKVAGLATDFIVIESGARPRTGFGFGLLVAGFLFALFRIFFGPKEAGTQEASNMGPPPLPGSSSKPPPLPK